MRSDLARALASAFLAGDWTRQGLVESGASALGRRPRWLAPLALVATQMLTNRWRLPVLEGLDDVAAFLDVEPGDLDWFSDPRRLARSAADVRLQHYRVSHRAAPSGAVRVLEHPSPGSR